jgi:hypothetical protein
MLHVAVISQHHCCCVSTSLLLPVCQPTESKKTVKPWRMVKTCRIHWAVITSNLKALSRRSGDETSEEQNFISVITDNRPANLTDVTTLYLNSRCSARVHYGYVSNTVSIRHAIQQTKIYCALFFLLGDSPASESYVSTFRNTVTVIFIGYVNKKNNWEQCSL